MKSALVLGFALAASAMAADQAENELFVSPQGKLADLAKKYPGMIMYDDDELMDTTIPYRTLFTSQTDYNQYRLQVQNHLIQNEMRDRLKNKPFIKRDDTADDELVFKSFQKDVFCARNPDHPQCTGAQKPWKLHLEADDEELYVPPMPDFRRYRVDAFGKVLKDDIGRPLPPVLARFDEAADDELIFANKKPYEHAIFCKDDPNLAFCNGSFSHKKQAFEEFKTTEKYKEYLRNRQRVRKDDIGIPLPPVLARFDETTDDELAFRPNVPREVQMDDADDELAYLGQLIQDRSYISARAFDDDEFRAERPGKSQEKSQKTEGPKNKKKLRPIVEERPAYQE